MNRKLFIVDPQNGFMADGSLSVAGSHARMEALDCYSGRSLLRRGSLCCLSTSYFGTLVKTETGRTAKDIINEHLLAKAKELLNSYETETKQKFTVAQVSYRLGFEYPQHFVRFFKALTGMTPTQWRAA